MEEGMCHGDRHAVTCLDGMVPRDYAACRMVQVPSGERKDARRTHRERQRLIAERVVILTLPLVRPDVWLLSLKRADGDGEQETQARKIVAKLHGESRRAATCTGSAARWATLQMTARYGHLRTENLKRVA